MAARRRTEPLDPTRAVGYVRVSTDEQALGPEAQRDALAAWCDANGATLVACFEDHGVSGATPVDRRPGLTMALDALAAEGAGVLLVAKRDRLARDIVVGAVVERLVEREGARVLSADGTGNEDRPEDQLMRNLVASFATYEKALIAARTRAALAVKKARGERVGSVPYGFRVTKDGALEPDDDEQEMVAVARRLRERGLSLRAIDRELRARGHLPRNGRAWHVQTLATIVRG